MDPTLEFLERLKDESKWVIRRGVPVFEAHTRVGVGPDGKPKKVEVTDDDLPRIAANSNQLFESKGVPGRVTDRHTVRVMPDGSMVPVPEAVLFGFELNYRVAPTGPDQKLRVVTDRYLFPEHAAKADRSPYRSVEYQHQLKLIRGTAVMMNDPFLDMGMVVFGTEGDYTFSTEEETMFNQPPNHEDAVAHMFANPGMSYTQALSETATVSAPAEPYHSSAPTGWETDPHAAPPYYEAAMEYMLEHPGMTYSKACEHIQATTPKATPRPVDPTAPAIPLPEWHHAAIRYMHRNAGVTYDYAVLLMKHTRR